MVPVWCDNLSVMVRRLAAVVALISLVVAAVVTVVELASAVLVLILALLAVVVVGVGGWYVVIGAPHVREEHRWPARA